jgi:opacity protein-like surface antigen
MKNSTWIKGGLASVALACGASTASATESGFYLGLNVGQSKFEVGDDTEEFIDLFGSSDIDDSDTAWNLAGGYRFNPYFALELSYVDLGQASAYGEDNFGSFYERVDFSAESSGFAIALVPAIPAGPVEFNPRVGFYLGNTDISYSQVARAPGFNFSGSDSGDVSSETLVLGLGIGVALADHFQLRFDWTRYSDVGGEVDLGGEEFEYEEDIDTLTVGVAYRF